MHRRVIDFLESPGRGQWGVFDAGFGKSFADALIPVSEWDRHGREYWRSFGFILAWPLFIWNVFSSQSIVWWLAISFVQTFVIIPALIYFWGKGAYCGWVCSCGALAETMGDAHRQKMPHDPFWNRLNMVGQVILAAALLLFVARALSAGCGRRARAACSSSGRSIARLKKCSPAIASPVRMAEDKTEV